MVDSRQQTHLTSLILESGARASRALKILLENGFQPGQLFNGLGVGNWEEAGFALVNDTSVEPPCLTDTAVQTECRNMVLAAQGDVTTDQGMVGDDMEDNGKSSAPTFTLCHTVLGMVVAMMLWTISW